MFCGECGTKNEAGSTFCQNCGKSLSANPVVEEVKEEKKEEGKVVEPTSNPAVSVSGPVVNNNPKQPMSKKKKMILLIVFAVAIVLGISYKLLSDKYSPKTIAKDYISAVISCDGNKMYKYLDTAGDGEFLDKGAFVKYVKDECDSLINNFKITKVEYSDSKLSATVTFSYTTKLGKEDTDKIVLTRGNKKKLFLFNDWQVGSEFDGAIEENYTIVVDKGSKLIFGDKVVSEKYINLRESSDTEDCYVLPKVLSIKTNVKVVLANGFTYEKEVTPSSYEKDLTLDEYVISDEIENTIYENAKNMVVKLYSAVIEGKTADEVKAMFNHKADLTNLGTHYTSLVNNIKGSYDKKLTKFEVTSGSLYDLGVTKDGYLEVEVKLYYNYSIDYTDYSDTPQTNDSTDYAYITLLLDYSDGNYYLVDGTDLEDYFSTY